MNDEEENPWILALRGPTGERGIKPTDYLSRIDLGVVKVENDETRSWTICIKVIGDLASRAQKEAAEYKKPISKLYSDDGYTFVLEPYNGGSFTPQALEVRDYASKIFVIPKDFSSISATGYAEKMISQMYNKIDEVYGNKKTDENIIDI